MISGQGLVTSKGQSKGTLSRRSVTAGLCAFVAPGFSPAFRRILTLPPWKAQYRKPQKTVPT